MPSVSSHPESSQSHATPKPALLCISQSFAPDTSPTAIRAASLLQRCSREWDVTVLSESRRPAPDPHIRVEFVRARRPTALNAMLRRLRLAKLLELVVWPDDSIFWALPAILAGRRLIRELRPRAIVVFMMPYSSGLVGLVLSRLSGLPLILNLDDSPTCTDMHPHFPTRLHYRLAKALEDLYVRWADAVVYVSQTNLESVRARSPERAREKLHLVRYGADRVANAPPDARGEDFEIVYVGAMSGWWSLIGRRASVGRLQSLHEAWTRLGRYERVRLDQSTSSPASIGRAILQLFAERPDWRGRVRLTIYGNPYPASLVERALADSGLDGVVTVHGPVPHDQVAGIIARADLLFLTLPDRPDGSRGGRISAKTYEYLATDRPIIAAVPAGENWDYLTDRPGVWLVEPSGERRMTEVIRELADAKFAGRPSSFDRDDLHRELSYDVRADEFSTVLKAAIERRLKESSGHRAR
jgi:hypothetical protein